jgi:hypothetical protein
MPKRSTRVRTSLPLREAPLASIHWASHDRDIRSIHASHQANIEAINAIYGKGPQRALNATVDVVRQMIMGDIQRHVSGPEVRERMRTLGLC